MHKTIRHREAALDRRLGKSYCFIGGDEQEIDPLVGQAAKENAEISRDFMEWYKDQAEEMKPIQREAADIAMTQARQQITSAQKQDALADESAARAKTFQPAEDLLLKNAMGYDTAERREQVAGQAMADVGSQVDLARGNVIRLASARGVDVSSPAFTANMGRTVVQEAAAKAAAGNQARLTTEQIGAAKLADAAAIGKGVVSNSAAQTQLALAAGNSGVANAGVPLTQNNQTVNTAGGAYGVGIQGNNSAGNLMLGSANASKSDDSGAMAGLGSAVGGIAVAF